MHEGNTLARLHLALRAGSTEQLIFIMGVAVSTEKRICVEICTKSMGFFYPSSEGFLNTRCVLKSNPNVSNSNFGRSYI